MNDKPKPYEDDPFGSDGFYDPSMYFDMYHGMSSHLSVDIPDFKNQTVEGQVVNFPIDVTVTRNKIIENLQQVYDPEIPVNVWDLGLIYKLELNEAGSANVVMTLTTPNCPSAQELPEVIQMAISAVPGIMMAQLDLTFDPPWNPKDMISEDGKLVMIAEYGMDFDN